MGTLVVLLFMIVIVQKMCSVTIPKIIKPLLVKNKRAYTEGMSSIL